MFLESDFQGSLSLSNVLHSTAKWYSVYNTCSAQEWIDVFHSGELLLECRDDGEDRLDIISSSSSHIPDTYGKHIV